jgi:alpha-methylacyl-CoA racemase
VEAAAALAGVRILDLSRLAPGPFCSMLLADFGADVILVEPPGGATRKGEPAAWELERDHSLYVYDGLRRNKRSIVLNLKEEQDRTTLGRLVRTADAVIEGFRPGVAERLGASYDQCRELNPRVIHCAISGFGTSADAATKPGHDINYIAEAGILAAIGSGGGRPAIPINLLADFAGGGLYAAFAIMLALFHRERTGEGQEIRLAMVDGAFSLLTQAASLFFARGMRLAPRTFFLTGGLPYYDVYQCGDGQWVALGALEPWFFADLCRLTGRPELTAAHNDPSRFEEIARHLERWFAARTRAEALAELSHGDACASPVLTLEEAIDAAEARGKIVRPGGIPQVGIAPHLSRTPGIARSPGPRPDEHRAEIEADLAVREGGA